MNPVTVIPGTGPVVLAQPHSGTYIPPEILSRLNSQGRQLLDTDWHIPALYDGLAPDAAIVSANFSRYVVDPNRDPAGKSLYPGQNTTGLVPLITFDGEAIWKTPLTKDAVRKRMETYHKPYHDALRGELDCARKRYGFAVLFDCHSIRSEIPHLFHGRLPDLNIGTNDGASCGQSLSDAVMAVCERQSDYTHVLNGRFKGGWTTRHYGDPDAGVHAIQMELSQRNYLQTERPPFDFDIEGATRLRALLKDILTAIRTTIETPQNGDL